MKKKINILTPSKFIKENFIDNPDLLLNKFLIFIFNDGVVILYCYKIEHFHYIKKFQDNFTKLFTLRNLISSQDMFEFSLPSKRERIFDEQDLLFLYII